MAWIDVHTTIENHPKTHALRRYMGWSKNETIGMLVRFWLMSLDLSRDGNVTDVTVTNVFSDIFSMPENETKKAIEGMIETGWLDRDLDGNTFIHNHDQYRSRYSDIRENNRLRQQKSREKRRVTEMSRDKNVTVTSVTENNAQHNITIHNNNDLSVSREEIFSQTLCNLAREIVGLTPEGLLTGWMTVQKWPEDWIAESLQISAESGKRGNKAAQYAAGIMRDWSKNGKPEKDEINSRNSGLGFRNCKSAGTGKYAEIDRAAREEGERLRIEAEQLEGRRA